MNRLAFIILLTAGLTAGAQESRDTLNLPEFEIRSNFQLSNQGFKKVRMDSSLFIPNLNADLSGILSEHSTIFIKSYGSGTLATPSFRGTSAQHTQVEWNGINLNSPMLGQMDLSQVPVAQFDGLEILYGAAGISRTSGAFGGVIDLVTMPDWNNRFNIFATQNASSFGTWITNLSLAAGGRSFQSHTRLNYHTAKNDFPYTNDAGEVVRQYNASFLQTGLSQELYWKLKDRHLLSGRIWYSQDDRNLPPTTQTVDSSKTETLKDNALRAVLDYKYVASGWNLLVRSALNDQYMKYDNSTLDLHSVHKVFSWINRVRGSYSAVKNLNIKAGADYTYDWVDSDEYEGIRTRSTVSLSAEATYEWLAGLSTTMVLREDIINGDFKPFIPALGFDYQPFRKINLAFSFNLARNFRNPTLNELYWENAGNPELLPEKNYTAEGGCVYNLGSEEGRFFVETVLTAYYSWIYDMITWTQVEGSGIFRPENVDEIHARGLELGVNAATRAWGFRFLLKTNYNYCRSTYEKGKGNYADDIGNQQFYIPVNTLNSTLTLERWRFFLAWNYVFTGERFTGKDNLSLMPAYNLSNIIFGKNIEVNHFILSLQIDINNLFNLDYQSVASRPMPGINGGFTLKVGFRR